MADFLSVEIILPDCVKLKVETTSLIVPAIEGSLGVWPNHAPIITGLEPGVLKYRQGENFCAIAVSSGFMEVDANVATILVHTAEEPEEIDVKRAQAAKKRAEKRLHKYTPGLDVQRAQLALHRAIARLKTAKYNG